MIELSDKDIEGAAGGAPMAVTDESADDLLRRGCTHHTPIDGGDCPSFKCVLDAELSMPIKYCSICSYGIVRSADREIYCTKGL